MDGRAGVVIAGASGRMGQMLIRTLPEVPGLGLHACLERPGHPWIGQDVGVAMGGAPLGVRVGDDPLEALVHARALIDFTTPAATVAHAGVAAQARIVHVIGTTGFDAAEIAALTAAARHAVIVRAGNMSLGVNLLAGLVRKVAGALGPEWDIEIVEAHHRMKVDAPSGTALLLGEAAAKGRGVSLSQAAVRARDGHTGARVDGTIGFQALRGGTVVGDHAVVLAGNGERIELRHIAEDRGLFAQGAVKAALWGWAHGRSGFYSMNDVLGIEA